MTISCYMNSISVKKIEKEKKKKKKKQRIFSDYNQKKEKKKMRRKEKPERFEAWGVLNTPLLVGRENSMTRNAGGLEELRESPCWQPARNQEPQHHNLKELSSTNNLNKSVVGSPLQPPEGVLPAAPWFQPSLWDSKQKVLLSHTIPAFLTYRTVK